MAPIIRQIRCGRIAAFSSSPSAHISEGFRTTDWDPATSISVSLQSSGTLRFSAGSAATRRFNRFIPAGDLADAFVQCIWSFRSTGGGGGPVLRSDDQAIPGAGVALQVPSGFSGTEQLIEYDSSGTQVQTDADSGIDRAMPERLSMYTAGTEAKSYNHDANDERSLTGLAVSSGAAALYYSSGGSANAIDYSAFYLMRSHLITVRGPDAAWRARIKDSGGTVLAEADASGGVAQVDCFAARVVFPNATRIEIYDPAEDEVLCDFDPQATVWGGDEWVYYAEEPAPPASLTRDSSGKRAAYSDSPISGVEDAFDAGDWSTSGPGAISVNAGRLRYTNSGSDADVLIREDASEDDGPDHFVQFINHSISGGGTGLIGAGGRFTTASPGSLQFLIQRAVFAGSSTFGLVEREEPTNLGTDLVTLTNLSGAARAMIDISGAVARGFDFGRLTKFRLTGLTLAGDFAGVYKGGGSAGNTRDWSAYYRMTSPILTVTGEDANWRALVRDAAGDLLAEADAVAGVATLDLYEFRVRFPSATRVEVVDLDDPERTPLLYGEPSDRVWGGDAYSFVSPPETPTGLAVDIVGAFSASLSWDAAEGADGYRLFRATAAEGPYTEVADTEETSAADSGLEPLTQYWWRVVAHNAAGESDPSDPVSTTTLEAVPEAPAAPVVSTISESALSLSWAAVPYATSYEIWRSLTEVGGYELIASQAGLAYLDSGLESDTEYFYRIQACSGAGCSALGPAGSGTTAAVAQFRPCSFLLEVYEADGVTVAWEVSTDPVHPLPFLQFPGSYGAREIDPVTGAGSIGTIDVTVADVPLVAGDQDGGFVTARLDGIFGRRCRLRRYVNAQVGFVVIADGPAGAPRMHESYAGYTWAIRDVREVERSLRPFSTGGTCALAPRGPIAGWGVTDDGFLVDPVEPFTGEMIVVFNESAQEWFGSVDLTDERWSFLAFPDVTFPAEFEIGEEAVKALNAVVIGDRAVYPFADVLWRPAGSDEPFRVARPSEPAAFGYRIGGVVPGRITDTEEATQALASVRLFAAATPPEGFPEHGDPVEVILRSRAVPSEEYPYYYEGTLGGLLRSLYNRELEVAPVPPGGTLYDPAGLDDIGFEFGGGIRIDDEAFDLLTTPVLFRLTEEVDDGRAWAEEFLYAPSGWIPSLDEQGRISPVQRARPEEVTLPEVNNGNAEPAPDWDAGERVITRCRLTYRRYFRPTNPLIERGPDGVAVRDVVLEYVDPAASLRHNEQLEEFDASLFGSIGDPDGTIADLGGEVGQVLGQGLLYEVLERYRLGAPAFRVAVLRSAIPGVREGSWVPVDLSWLPKLGETRRGLVAEAAQVLSIEDLDCDWRTLLLEVSPVAAAPGYFTDLERVGDVPQPGYFTTLMLVDDVESEES